LESRSAARSTLVSGLADYRRATDSVARRKNPYHANAFELGSGSCRARLLRRATAAFRRIVHGRDLSSHFQSSGQFIRLNSIRLSGQYLRIARPNRIVSKLALLLLLISARTGISQSHVAPT